MTATQTESGSNWTNVTVPTNSILTSVAYGGGTWLASSIVGETFLSTNGTSWQPAVKFPSGLLGAHYAGGRWLVVGSNIIAMSTNPAAAASWNVFGDVIEKEL